MNITIPTSDTRIAAALSTLGYPLKIDVIYNDHTGDSEITYHIDIQSVIPEIKLTSNDIINQLKEKKLAPLHPVMEGLRALHNRSCVIKVIKENKTIELVASANGKRYVYNYGGLGLPGKAKQTEMVSTTDVKVVAAMASLGVPLLTIEDQSPREKFYLPLYGLDLKGERMNSAELLRDFRNGSLALRDPEHPFLYAMLAQNSYSTILASVEKQEELVLLRKKNSTKAAYIRAGASDKAFDEVHKHFGL